MIRVEQKATTKVALASIIGARYLAIGTGDTELYVFAGMAAAVVISIRVFIFRGAGKANGRSGPPGGLPSLTLLQLIFGSRGPCWTL